MWFLDFARTRDMIYGTVRVGDVTGELVRGFREFFFPETGERKTNQEYGQHIGRLQNCERPNGADPGAQHQNVAAQKVSSRIRFTGVSAARRSFENPASCATLRRRFSPACAPRPSPTSCDSEFGVHAMADAA